MKHHTTIITNNLSIRKYLSDIWQFRELGIRLAIKQLLVTYKQTAVGVLWTILRPLSLLIVFILVLQRMVNTEGLDMPYPVFATVGLVFWQFFTSIVSDSGAILIYERALITKIYFPRILLPISSIIARSVDFMIALIFLTTIMIIFSFTPSWHIVFMPIFVLVTIISSLGIGLIVSAISITYRDFLYLVPVILQVGFFLSPVFYYSKTLVPNNLYTIYALNPIVFPIEGMRWALVGGSFPLSNIEIFLSLVIGNLLLLTGALIFLKYEKIIADII